MNHDNEIIPASSGTGFVISNSGLMVTNYHVIEGCFNVKALYDQKDIGISGVIIGKAIYEKKFDLKNLIMLLGD